jgi:hypothetical protein
VPHLQVLTEPAVTYPGLAFEPRGQSQFPFGASFVLHELHFILPQHIQPRLQQTNPPHLLKFALYPGVRLCLSVLNLPGKMRLSRLGSNIPTAAQPFILLFPLLRILLSYPFQSPMISPHPSRTVGQTTSLVEKIHPPKKRGTAFLAKNSVKLLKR